MSFRPEGHRQDEDSSLITDSGRSPEREQTCSLSQFPMSSIANGIGFYFTEQPNSSGWNHSSSLMNPMPESEDEDDTIQGREDGKSYDAFESKLNEGFLEAPNLGLVCAPPAMFDYNPPLRRVDLKDNKIETLPDHFFDELPLLSWCDLRYNRLTNLPEMNFKNDCLNVLLLQDNQLCDLPCSLAYASNLHTLGWTNNNIIEPPRQILLQGCKKTLEYLRYKLLEQIPVDELGNVTTLESDAQLEKDLSQTAKKSSLPKRSKSRASINTDKSGKSSEDAKREELQNQKRIDRIKYTWGLWKSVPYEGVSHHRLFEKSLEEVRNEVRTKLNQDKESMLQKIKDHATLGQFRWDARMRQMKGPEKPYEGMSTPFATDADKPIGRSDGEPLKLTPEVMRTTIVDCLNKLQEFAHNPTPLNDTQKSMERLREVEEVQQKLLNMRVAWSVKSSDPA